MEHKRKEQGEHDLHRHHLPGGPRRCHFFEVGMTTIPSIVLYPRRAISQVTPISPHTDETTGAAKTLDRANTKPMDQLTQHRTFAYPVGPGYIKAQPQCTQETAV